MLLKLPNGTIEINPEPHDVVIIAVPKHLVVTRVRTFPGETHRAVSVGRNDERLEVTSGLNALVEKHAAHSTNERLFLAAAVYLSPHKKDVIECSEVRLALEEAGFKRLRQPSATLAVLVRKGLCERAGRGLFWVTKAGRRFLATKPRRTRPATKGNRRKK